MILTGMRDGDDDVNACPNPTERLLRGPSLVHFVDAPRRIPGHGDFRGIGDFKAQYRRFRPKTSQPEI